MTKQSGERTAVDTDLYNVTYFGHADFKQARNYFTMLVLHLYINYNNNAKCIFVEVSVCIQAWSHSVTQFPISAYCHPIFGHPPLVITFLCLSTLKFGTWNTEFFFLFAQPLLLLPPAPSVRIHYGRFSRVPDPHLCH